MTSHELLRADVLDIVFDNRNKQYGAYVLRKTYNTRLTIALGLALSSAALLFLIPAEQHHPLPPDQHSGTVVVRTVDIFPQPKPEMPVAPAPQAHPFRQKMFTRLVIRENDEVKAPVPDSRELMTAAISDRTMEGPELKDPVTLAGETVRAGAGNPDPKKDETKAAVQREPEFPGGPAAWLDFLRRNLVSPVPLEPGEKKTVAIRFLVSAEGRVTDFEVVQSAAKVFDNEVIRVLKKMPKWRPAIQNNLPVARAFTQPVTFIGAEE